MTDRMKRLSVKKEERRKQREAEEIQYEASSASQASRQYIEEEKDEPSPTSNYR